MINNIKKLKLYIKKKISGSLMDRIDLIQYICILIAGISSSCLIYRSIQKYYNNQPIKLHSIYDKNGYIMAYNVLTYQVNIDPQKIINFDEFYEQIKHINFDKENLKKNISQKEPFILQKDLNIKDITNIKHPAINIVKFIKRQYPLDNKFTTIGFSDLRKGIIKGIERMAITSDVHLTIDLRFQSILSDALETIYRTKKAQFAFGLIINMDGEILGMHTTKAPSTKHPKDFFNDCFFGLYEYGSICKLFVVMAGLYYKKFEMESVIDTDEGDKLFQRKMQDFEPIPRYSDVYTIISKSSNRGTIALQRKIGANKILKFYKKLKLNEKINIGIFTTIQPKFFNKYKEDEIYSIGFGYNFMTNAFNIIRAFLIIFNNGDIINPTLIQENVEKRKVGKINNIDYSKIISVMQRTAQRHKILAKLKCASKSGMVDRIHNGKYDKTKTNGYYICAVPDTTGKFKYLMLLCLIDPEEYDKAGVNLRELAASIARKIYLF